MVGATHGTASGGGVLAVGFGHGPVSASVGTEQVVAGCNSQGVCSGEAGCAWVSSSRVTPGLTPGAGAAAEAFGGGGPGWISGAGIGGSLSRRNIRRGLERQGGGVVDQGEKHGGPHVGGEIAARGKGLKSGGFAPRSSATEKRAGGSTGWWPRGTGFAMVRAQRRPLRIGADMVYVRKAGTASAVTTPAQPQRGGGARQMAGVGWRREGRVQGARRVRRNSSLFFSSLLLVYPHTHKHHPKSGPRLPSPPLYPLFLTSLAPLISDSASFQPMNITTKHITTNNHYSRHPHRYYHHTLSMKKNNPITYPTQNPLHFPSAFLRTHR